MSDIGLPPGMGLFLVSLGLVVIAVGAMVFLLLIATATERGLPFRRRRAYSLFLGMWLPGVLGIAGFVVAQYGPRSLLQAMDRSPEIYLVGPALLSLLVGLAWGFRRKKES